MSRPTIERALQRSLVARDRLSPRRKRTEVLSTNFISEQHSLTRAYQNNGHLFTMRGAVEHIPYQGFPNQRMDMTGNRGYTAEAKYLGAYDWGLVDARAFWHHVTHTMGFLYDKQPANMPMNTIAHDFGYSIKTEIPLRSSPATTCCGWAASITGSGLMTGGSRSQLDHDDDGPLHLLEHQ